MAALGPSAVVASSMAASTVQNRILGNYRESLAGGGPGAQGGPGGAIALGGATHACAAESRPGGRVPWQAGRPMVLVPVASPRPTSTQWTLSGPHPLSSGGPEPGPEARHMARSIYIELVRI